MSIDHGFYIYQQSTYEYEHTYLYEPQLILKVQRNGKYI